jgi:hypothetical protein
MPYQKVTMIEDLPELDQVDVNSQSIAQPESSEMGRKINRFIRSNVKNLPPESGMQLYYQSGVEDDDTGYGIPVMMDQSQNVASNYRPAISESYCNNNPVCCQDMYNHVKDCYICQKFYKTDNTIYLIIIAILVIACALLAKKVLNV